MPEMYWLTEEEIRTIQSVLDLVRNQLKNTQRGDKFLENDHQAPEFYVARAPSDGIPSMVEASGTGTGTGVGVYPSMVAADCQIYQVLEREAEGLAEVIPVGGLTKRVFNISTSAIAGDTWFQVTRDKFGTWVTVGAGGSTSDIWGQITDCENYAHSWVQVEKAYPTSGGFPTVPGSSFIPVIGGLFGLNNLYERNRAANIEIGSYVKIYPWIDDTWVCEYDKDHFTGYITGGSGPSYQVTEESDNPRIVTAYEFNGVIDIPEGTRVQVWIYLVAGEFKYEFTYQNSSITIINITNIDVTDITNVIQGITYNSYSTITNLVVRYEYVCVEGYCGWINLCDCSWIPWYCYNNTCRQFLTPPPGAIGPFTTRPACEAVAPCTATGTDVLPTGTGTGTGEDCAVGTILVSCCTNLLPCRLYMCVIGCCEGLTSIPLNFVQPSNWVSDDIQCGDHTLSFNIYCQGGRWFIVVVCDDVTHSIRRLGTALSCDPVELSFDITGAIKLANCCEENITATVTETPVDCEDPPSCSSIPTTSIDISVANETGFYNDTANCMVDNWQNMDPTPKLAYSSGTWQGTAQCCNNISISLACSGTLADAVLTVSPSNGTFTPSSWTATSLTFHVVWTTPNIPGCSTTSPSEMDVVISW